MLIIILSVLFIAAVHHIKSTQLKPQYSQAVLFFLLLLFVVDIALAQNFFASLNFRDKGITTTNIIARIAFLGDQLTVERFQVGFNRWLAITIIAFFGYVGVWMREKQTLPYKKERYWAFVEKLKKRVQKQEHKK